VLRPFVNDDASPSVREWEFSSKLGKSDNNRSPN
jgi:hypothetical protein